MITCRQCREDLAEYALGTVDAAPAEQVAAHLAVCPACRQELNELQADWSAITLTLDRAEPRREVFDSLLERIDAEGDSIPAASTSPLTRSERVLSYLLAACILIGLTAAFWRITQRGDDEAAVQSAERLAERLGKLQEMERLLAAENVRVVTLKPQPSTDAIEAYVIWDVAAGQWHFYASNLPVPPAGRDYQLWAATNDGRRLAGPTFKVDANGLGSVVADLPESDIRGIAKALVTLEPAGGSKQPTGKVYLEAAL